MTSRLWVVVRRDRRKTCSSVVFAVVGRARADSSSRCVASRDRLGDRRLDRRCLFWSMTSRDRRRAGRDAGAGACASRARGALDPRSASTSRLTARRPSPDSTPHSRARLEHSACVGSSARTRALFSPSAAGPLHMPLPARGASESAPPFRRGRSSLSFGFPQARVRARTHANPHPPAHIHRGCSRALSRLYPSLSGATAAETARTVREDDEDARRAGRASPAP